MRARSVIEALTNLLYRNTNASYEELQIVREAYELQVGDLERQLVAARERIDELEARLDQPDWRQRR